MAKSPTLTQSASSAARILGAVVAIPLIAAPIFSASAAGGGGGGGGGGSPSASAPSYDPAQEYREGIAALNAGDPDRAARHFRKVTSAARKNAQGHYMLGLSYLRAGKVKKARKPLEKAVRYAPDMIAAHRDLGVVLASLDRPEDAAAILTTLTERANACGAGCAQKGELDQAIAAVRGALNGEAPGQALSASDLRVLADASAADSLYYEAVGQINAGAYRSALRTLDRAALAFGPHPDILTYQGFANRKLARFTRAQAYYDRALAIAPNHLGAIEYYGELKVERGDMAGANQHLAKLERLCAFGCYEAEELRKWINAAAL